MRKFTAGACAAYETHSNCCQEEIEQNLSSLTTFNILFLMQKLIDYINHPISRETPETNIQEKNLNPISKKFQVKIQYQSTSIFSFIQ